MSLTCLHVGCLDCGFPVNEVDTTSFAPHSQGTEESFEMLKERKNRNPPSHLNVVVYNQNHGAVYTLSCLGAALKVGSFQ